MMEKKEILRAFVYIFVILIVIGLAARVHYRGKEMRCSNCLVNFKFIRGRAVEDLPKVYTEFNVTAFELYEGIKRGRCVVVWDRVNGYLYRGLK